MNPHPMDRSHSLQAIRQFCDNHMSERYNTGVSETDLPIIR